MFWIDVKFGTKIHSLQKNPIDFDPLTFPLALSEQLLNGLVWHLSQRAIIIFVFSLSKVAINNHTQKNNQAKTLTTPQQQKNNHK